jgi:hypothetical protein
MTPRLIPPPWAVRLVLAVRRSLLWAANAIVPPQVALFEGAVGVAKTESLAWVARNGVADILAAGPLTSEALAERVKAHPDRVHRLMRGCASLGVFRFRNGRWENNRYSDAMRRDYDGNWRDFLLYFASESNVRAWRALDGTMRTGRSSFRAEHGMSVWDWFDAHPDERETFAGAMASLTRLDAPGIVAAYPWREISVLADVGGGRGLLLGEILRAAPHLNAILVDGQGVVALAREHLASLGVADRVQLVPGSFFEGVPSGADAALLKNILHDWDDDASARILDRVRAALPAGGRVLVVEALVEPDTTVDLGPLADLQMMLVGEEGRERGRADFDRLLSAAGFRLERILPTAGMQVIVEGRAV